MKLGLFLCEFAALDHVSDHRVVARNEAHVFACKMIGAAIANVDDDGQIAADPDGDERCAHAGKIIAQLRLLKDGAVG